MPASLESLLVRPRRSLALCGALGLLAAAVAPAAAQRPDSTRAAVAPRPAAADTLRAVADSAPSPPLTPKRAFILSLLAPGYAQTVLGRPTAAALFVLAEAVSTVMIIESSASLREARRLARDTVFLGTDPQGNPQREPGVFPRSLVRSRQAQVEDWIAVLLANHVFAGADAYVAAHLWDVPIRVGPAPASKSLTIGTSVRW